MKEQNFSPAGTGGLTESNPQTLCNYLKYNTENKTITFDVCIFIHVFYDQIILCLLLKNATYKPDTVSMLAETQSNKYTVHTT